MTTSTRLLDYLREHRPGLLDLLVRLASVESPSQDAESQKAVLEILSGELSKLGYSTRYLPGRQNGRHLYARLRQRERHAPVQLLLGHCDTVWPAGTLKEMPVEVGDGVVRGPGVYDMKGGLVQMVFALKALEALGLEPSVTPVVFVNSDEEMGSRSSRRYVRYLARVAERAFVMEPSFGPKGKIKTARKGVGRYSLTVVGEAAHAGLDPEGGASAILELSYLIQALFALNDPERGTSINVGTIDGGLSPNVIAPESRAVVDVRVPDREEADRVETEILGLKPITPGVSLKVEGSIGRPPLERTPRNQVLWKKARELGNDLGLELEEGMAGGRLRREHHEPVYRDSGWFGRRGRWGARLPRVRLYGQDGRAVRPARVALDGTTVGGKEKPMKEKYFFASLTRISDLEEKPFSVGSVSRRGWQTGDYVVGEVVSPPSGLSKIELSTGRMVEVVEGDLVVGAFGVRYATLEAVGGWQGIGQDRMMEAITSAGIFGKSTSRSTILPPLLSLLYKGHVMVDNEKATMQDFVPPASGNVFSLPVVLLVGTSMSAGKTTDSEGRGCASSGKRG